MVWTLRFRPALASGFHFSRGTHGGRPPYDAVLIFKVLILQSLYNLSDDQTEYQIKDRLSFMRFLGLDLWENVPDAAVRLPLWGEIRLTATRLMRSCW